MGILYWASWIVMAVAVLAGIGCALWLDHASKRQTNCHLAEEYRKWSLRLFALSVVVAGILMLAFLYCVPRDVAIRSAAQATGDRQHAEWLEVNDRMMENSMDVIAERG